MTEQERLAFLAAPHIGALSVANDDDRPPRTVPIWCRYAPGGDLPFFHRFDGRSGQARCRADPRRAGATTD